MSTVSRTGTGTGPWQALPPLASVSRQPRMGPSPSGHTSPTTSGGSWPGSCSPPRPEATSASSLRSGVERSFPPPGLPGLGSDERNAQPRRRGRGAAPAVRRGPVPGRGRTPLSALALGDGVRRPIRYRGQLEPDEGGDQGDRPPRHGRGSLAPGASARAVNAIEGSTMHSTLEQILDLYEQRAREQGAPNAYLRQLAPLHNRWHGFSRGRGRSASCCFTGT
jgi:hypothetical protein